MYELNKYSVFFSESSQFWLEPINPRSLWLIAPALLVIGFLLFRFRVAGRRTLSQKKRWLFFGLRFLLVAAVVFSLIEWNQHQIRKQPAELVVVFDLSQSVDHVDDSNDELMARLAEIGLDSTSRLDQARSVLLLSDAERVRWMRKNYRLRLATIGERVQQFSSESKEETGKVIHEWDAAQNQSRIGDGLIQLIRNQLGHSTAAIICFTDGANTHGEPIDEAVRLAKSNGIPLFFVGLGSESPPSDVGLSDLQHPKTVYLNDIVQFKVRVTALSLKDQNFTVQLKDAKSGSTIDIAEVAATNDSYEEIVQLQANPQSAGRLDYVIEVEPVSDESYSENNTIQTSINVRDEEINVLLIQSYPSNEYRFLKRLLSRQQHASGEKAIVLHSILLDADYGLSEIDDFEIEGFPGDLSTLAEYDVVILGDVRRGQGASREYLNDRQLELIHQYVTQNGGCLIMIGGARYLPARYIASPISDLFPFELQGESSQHSVIGERLNQNSEVRVFPTEIAAQLPLFVFPGNHPQQKLFEILPTFRWWQKLPPLKPGVIVLSEARLTDQPGTHSFPITVFRIVNAGRIVYQASDEVYRWRQLVGEQYYGHYWLQLIRFLARGQIDNSGNGRIELRKSVFDENESIDIQIRLSESQLGKQPIDQSLQRIQLVIHREGEIVRNVSFESAPLLNGQFEGKIDPLPPGNYWVQLVDEAKRDRATSNGELDSVVPIGAEFRVVASNRERASLVLQKEKLTFAAEQTGGAYVHIEDVDQLWSELPPGNSTVVDELPPRNIWADPFLATCFSLFVLGLLVTEWIIRKQSGLI